VKAVFDTKPTSIYDDNNSQYYQFPRRYLNVVNQCLGDWVVLRRPRADGGNLAYFAVAHLAAVEADANNRGMSFAIFSDYVQFDTPVSWRRNGRYAEEGLRNIPQREVGRFLRGRSVRLISDLDFVSLIAAGLPQTLSSQDIDFASIGFTSNIQHELEEGLPEERERKVKKVLTNRTIRDANFRTLLREAYSNRCAFTGLSIVDHAGNPEVQGAHIWAVADGGPDIVQNGIALSATVHWLFDRHLISLTDDYKLLIAKNTLPKEFFSTFMPLKEEIILPARDVDFPHPYFISKHREIFLRKNS
jgi:putative restriction endonuclease